MRIFNYISAATIGLSVGLLASGKLPQDESKLSPSELGGVLKGMGYEIKVLNQEVGKEKYEIPLKSDKLNIPVAAEVSPSGNYIWFTVYLGDNSSSKDHEQLLKENYNTQPTFFYITSKNKLMAAEAVDNRKVTPAIIRRVLDKLILDVDKTSSVWGK